MAKHDLEGDGGSGAQRGGSAMGDRGRSEAGGQTSTRSSAMRSRSTRMETTWSARDLVQSAEARIILQHLGGFRGPHVLHLVLRFWQL